MKYLNVGHKVLVHIPESDREAHAPIMKYHGKEMIVAARKSLGHFKTTYVYYELVGAESDHWGIPYGFIREWLIQV